MCVACFFLLQYHATHNISIIQIYEIFFVKFFQRIQNICITQKIKRILKT